MRRSTRQEDLHTLRERERDDCVLPHYNGRHVAQHGLERKLETISTISPYRENNLSNLIPQLVLDEMVL